MSAGDGITDLCADGAPDPLAPPDEYAAAHALFQLRFADDWGCESCGHRRCTQLRSRPRIFCCNRCDHPFSVTAGTTLHRCRVPLVKVFAAARLLCRPGVSISARALAKALGLGLETAWSLGHRLRAGFLDAPPARLSSEVAMTSPSIPQRLPKGERSRSPLGERVRFVLLADRSRRVAAVAGHPDDAGLRRFLDRHADIDQPEPGAVRLTYDPTTIGRDTHVALSDRWLPLYLAAVVGWQNAGLDGKDPAALTLRLALSLRGHPFARLRPRRPRLRHRTARELEAARDRVHAWDDDVRCAPVPESEPPPAPA